jgi:hypothetical protein
MLICCLLVSCTVVKVSSLFGCDTLYFGECLPTFWMIVVPWKLRWTLTWWHSSALCHCTVFSVLLWMWQSVCSSYCRQLNAVSFSTALHTALYRSIYSLLTCSSSGTLQGFLVCYCECGSPSVQVTDVSWMLSVSAQHFMLHYIIPYTVCWLVPLQVHCRDFSVLLWMWQSVCSSYCHQLNAVSISTALHAALYNSIYSLLTCSSSGTLQGF